MLVAFEANCCVRGEARRGKAKQRRKTSQGRGVTGESSSTKTTITTITSTTASTSKSSSGSSSSSNIVRRQQQSAARRGKRNRSNSSDRRPSPDAASNRRGGQPAPPWPRHNRRDWPATLHIHFESAHQPQALLACLPACLSAAGGCCFVPSSTFAVVVVHLAVHQNAATSAIALFAQPLLLQLLRLLLLPLPLQLLAKVASSSSSSSSRTEGDFASHSLTSHAVHDTMCACFSVRVTFFSVRSPTFEAIA